MKKHIACAVIILGIGTGSFYGGMIFAKENLQQRISGAGARFQQGGSINGNGAGSRGVGMGGEFVNGEVLSKDDTSITVKLRNGGSKIIFTSAATKVGKSVEGSLSDVTIGEHVMISGENNSDGSITAQSIQIRSSQEQNQNRER